MKKLTFMASMAIAAATLTSCGGSSAPSASLKSEIDTLSYVEGISTGQNFNNANVLSQLEVDSAYLDDFVRGIVDVVSASDDKKEAAYYAGVNIGQELAKGYLPHLNNQYFQGDSVNKISQDNFVAAFVEMITKGEGQFTQQAADSLKSVLSSRLQEKALEARFADEKKANEDFLAENAKNDSVTVTASGLQYKVLTQGTGAMPADTSVVRVDYEGRLIDGTVFDSSFERGEPAEFRLQGLIKGWIEALQLMPVGSEWEIYVPYELGYGVRGSAPAIPPFSTLIFRLKLHDIVNK